MVPLQLPPPPVRDAALAAAELDDSLAADVGLRLRSLLGDAGAAVTTHCVRAMLLLCAAAGADRAPATPGMIMYGLAFAQARGEGSGGGHRLWRWLPRRLQLAGCAALVWALLRHRVPLSARARASAGAAFSVARAINHLMFLRNGIYPTLQHRVFGLRVAAQSATTVSYAPAAQASAVATLATDVNAQTYFFDSITELYVYAREYFARGTKWWRKRSRRAMTTRKKVGELTRSGAGGSCATCGVQPMTGVVVSSGSCACMHCYACLHGVLHGADASASDSESDNECAEGLHRQCRRCGAALPIEKEKRRLMERRR